MSNYNNNSASYPGWTPDPDGRGTMSLLQSCLVTILICTWTACHLDLPADTDSEWNVAFRKLKWMGIFIIAPEAMSWLAICDFHSTRGIMNRINEVADSDGKTTLSGNDRWQLAHGFFANMGGFNLQLQTGERWRLNGEQVSHLVERKHIPMPSLTREDILDKSKVDWAAKLISVLQITWLIVQLLGRAQQGLETSPLELFTLAIVVCTLVSYGFWWHKPKDVLQPVIIYCDGHEITESGFMPDLKLKYDKLWKRTTIMDHINSDLTWDWPLIVGFIGTAIVFGGCHLLAWDYTFPTGVEGLLWRISSIACVVSPVLFVSTIAIDNWTLRRTPRAAVIFWYTCMIVPFTILVRTFLCVEVLISLRSVPASVYATVNWQEYIPHL